MASMAAGRGTEWRGADACDVVCEIWQTRFVWRCSQAMRTMGRGDILG